MKIFPAIDLKDGSCVRLLKGDFNNLTEYNKDPIDQAKIFLKNKAPLNFLIADTCPQTKARWARGTSTNVRGNRE